MKKSLMTIAIMAASVCMMASCGNKSANASGEAGAEAAADETSPAMELLNSVPFTEEGLLSMIKTPEGEALTDDEFEALFLAYSKVPVNEKNMELESNFIADARNKIMKNHKRPASAGDICLKLLKNASPQVRGVAVQQFGGLFGMSAETVGNLTNALDGEKDPFVLKHAIRTLANELKRPGASSFVLGQIDNENKFVRQAVAFSVGNSWSKGVDGVKEAALKLFGDSDIDVRKAILGNVGKLADDSFVPELVKVLDDPEQSKVHGDAMRSLYSMWYDYPFHKNTSKAAFEATVNYLKKTPRTKDIPAWTAVGSLETRNDKEYDAWKAQATYFNEAEWVKLMSEIAADPNANWLGRTPAVKVIAKYGSKADLEKLKAKVEANSGDSNQKFVLEAIEKALK